MKIQMLRRTDKYRVANIITVLKMVDTSVNLLDDAVALNMPRVDMYLDPIIIKNVEAFYKKIERHYIPTFESLIILDHIPLLEFVERIIVYNKENINRVATNGN